MVLADGLYGVYLRPFGSGILPYRLPVLCHLSHAILVCHEDVAVAHEDGIADFAAFQLVVIGPCHFPVFDDEHSPLFALSCVEEVVPGEALVGLLLLCGGREGGQCEEQ